MDVLILYLNYVFLYNQHSFQIFQYLAHWVIMSENFYFFLDTGKHSAQFLLLKYGDLQPRTEMCKHQLNLDFI